MIDKQLFEAALATAHEQCSAAPNGQCIHIQAINESKDALTKALAVALEVAMEAGVDPATFFFHMGLHVGYRLHQLEYYENPPDASS